MTSDEKINRGLYELQRQIFMENIGVTREINGTKIRVDSLQDTSEGTNVKVTIQPVKEPKHIQVDFKISSERIIV
jgi:hypothetical protein